MSTPIEHANLSARRFGGKRKDYLDIHEHLDSTKGAHPDLRHRVVTHNSWYVTNVLERIFGHTIKNSDGVMVSVRDIGQYHVMEDFNGHYPSLSDFASEIVFQPWMDNGKDGEIPPSNRGLPAPDLEKLYKPAPYKKLKSKPETDDSAEEYFRPGRGCGGGVGRMD